MHCTYKTVSIPFQKGPGEQSEAGVRGRELYHRGITRPVLCEACWEVLSCSYHRGDSSMLTHGALDVGS